MRSRRDFMKWGLVTGGATLAGLSLLKSGAIGQVTCPPLPQQPPGVDPMPRRKDYRSRVQRRHRGPCLCRFRPFCNRCRI